MFRINEEWTKPNSPNSRCCWSYLSLSLSMFLPFVPLWFFFFFGIGAFSSLRSLFSCSNMAWHGIHRECERCFVRHRSKRYVSSFDDDYKLRINSCVSRNPFKNSNISHILNPINYRINSIKSLAHQDLSNNIKGTFQFLPKFSAMI